MEPGKWSEAARGRLLVGSAACLWSTSGVFVTLLQAEKMPPSVIAAYRSLFAGVLLLAAFAVSRWRQRKVAPQPSEDSGSRYWDPRILSMVACFTLMTYTFITSMVLTNKANTVLLQYSATIWILIAGVVWLGEATDRRNLLAVLGGVIGVAVLAIGNWKSGADDRLGIFYGLLSGVTYAGVVVHLRALRHFDSLWLASLNHLIAGVILWFVLAGQVDQWSAAVPDPLSMAKLALFGGVQMGLPYFLFGLGLKRINAQEAGLLTLIEPLLNPLWTYLYAGTAVPAATLAGGAILLGTLVGRFAVSGGPK